MTILDPAMADRRWRMTAARNEGGLAAHRMKRMVEVDSFTPHVGLVFAASKHGQPHELHNSKEI